MVLTIDANFNRSQTVAHHSNRVSDSTEFSDSPLPIGGPLASLITTWSVVGNQSADEAGWLVNRYPEWQVSSFDDTLIPNTKSRSASLTYEPNTTEVNSITLEPTAAAETSITSGLKLITTIGRNSAGTVISVVENGGGTSGPCGTGSPLVRSTTMEFATNDTEQIFPSKVTNPLCQTTETFRDAVFGLVQASDDVNGVRSSFEYDALGRLLVFRPPGGAAQTYTYRSDVVTNALGISSRLRTTQYCFASAATGGTCSTVDPLGRVIRESTDGFDITIDRSFVHDRLGHLKSESLPNSSLLISYVSDNLGRMLSRTRPGESASTAGYKTSVAYSGRTIERTNERGVVSSRVVDAKGRVVREATKEQLTPTTSREIATEIEYGHFDLPRRVVHPTLNAAQSMTPNPAALVTTMTYDILGRRELIDDPDTGAVATRFDAFGQPKRSEDANGAVTTTSYDKLGRATRIETPSSMAYPSPNALPWAQQTTLVYDTALNGIGRLAKATSTEGIVTAFTFDEFGRPSAASSAENGNTYTFSYAYNQNGQVRTLSYPASGGKPFRLEYTYAGNGEIREIWDTSVVHGGGKKTPTRLWQQLEKNGAGQSTDEQFGSSMRTRRTYDSSYQLRLIDGKFLGSNANYQRLAYRWEGEGLMTRRTDLELGSAEGFEHDFLGRLKTWKVQQNCTTVQWTYGYDDWGNIRSRTTTATSLALPSQAYEYTAAGNTTRPHAVKKITETSGTASLPSKSFAYDSAGQMTAGRGTSFTWSPFGLPRSISNGTHSSSLSYDGLGRRVVQTQAVAGGVRRRVTVGGLYELNTSTATMTGDNVYNVYSSEGLVARVSRKINPASEAVTFVHRDFGGNADVVTTEVGVGAQRVGQLVERGKYDPFGERRFPWAIATPLAQTHTSGAGFTGHEPDDAFGLINMRGRIYDPKVGRFISPDPVGGAASQRLNRFSYVRNSPMTLFDPTGFGDACMGIPCEGWSGNSFTVEFDWKTPPPSAPQAQARSVPVATESRPASSPTSDDAASADSDALSRNQDVPLGWPLQGNAHYISPQMCSGSVCNDGPPKVHTGKYDGPYEKAETRRVAGFKRDVDLAMLSIHIALTLATFGMGMIAVETAGAKTVLPNLLPAEFAAELLAAERAGAVLIRPGTEAFAAAANQGTLKWVVTESGELLVTPAYVNGVEISHAFLSGGKGVLAAGQAEVAIVGEASIAVEIIPYSGHFLPPASTLSIGREAFAKFGLVFP